LHLLWRRATVGRDVGSIPRPSRLMRWGGSGSRGGRFQGENTSRRWKRGSLSGHSTSHAKKLLLVAGKGSLVEKKEIPLLGKEKGRTAVGHQDPIRPKRRRAYLFQEKRDEKRKGPSYVMEKGLLTRKTVTGCIVGAKKGTHPRIGDRRRRKKFYLRSGRAESVEETRRRIGITRQR